MKKSILILSIIMVFMFPTIAQAASHSVYGYTCVNGKYANNIHAYFVLGKPAPSIEENADFPNAQTQRFIQNYLMNLSSRGSGRVTDIIREVGSNYWATPVQLDALIWIARKESGLRPGARNGKYKGLFQLGNRPSWVVDGNAESETKAGCEYIKRRYKTPLRAKAFWLKHRWY